MGDPQNGWFMSWKIPLKWMVEGYPYFRKPRFSHIHDPNVGRKVGSEPLSEPFKKY